MRIEYEYKTELLKAGMSKTSIASKLQEQLNEAASDGWELFREVGDGAILIFRRKMS